MSGAPPAGFPSGYARAVLGPRDPVLDEILTRSLAGRGMPTIQIDDNAGRVLRLLTSLQRPRHVIEIGTLFGYSTVHIARGLPPEGRITSLEIDQEAAALARENLELAGVADRVEIVVGDAATYLPTVPPQTVGMVFIDADKKAYPDYLKLSYPLLEPRGLLIADDAFGQGDFIGESAAKTAAAREARAIHTYARAVGHSPRLFSAFIGTEQGMLISRKEA
ncbi:O-methyltransferase [Streptomyces sp. NPDC056347]|uniref:O-methyltransferase n=1 Tax=Streptomyces sp. NPDC056347 TaxID=3345790 RepID=UPI0035E317F5